jgi:chromosome segregation ATPase
MSIRDHKTPIVITLIVIAVIGLGTYKTIHFLNTGVSQPTQLSLVSNSQADKSKSSAAIGSAQSKSSTASSSSPTATSKTSSPSVSFAQADQAQSQANAQIAQDNAQEIATINAEKQQAQQENQTCQNEVATQTSAQAAIQQKIATISEEETDLPQTLKAQDIGGITESAFEEQLDQAMAQLQSQAQALEVQYNQIPSPDC